MQGFSDARAPLKSRPRGAVPWAAWHAAAHALFAALLAAALVESLRGVRLLPIGVLVRPWPLEVVVVAIAAGTARIGLRANDGATRRAALLSFVVAILSWVVLVVFPSRALPAPSPEVAVGRSLPDATLPDERGRPVRLGALRGHPSVFVFYRGGLCVACRAELSKFGARSGAFLAEGVEIIGVSSDPPEVSARWKDSLSLPFPLLSDPRRSLAESLCGQNAHCVLVVDPSGVIRWGALNDYWRGAAPAEAVLLAAYRLRA